MTPEQEARIRYAVQRCTLGAISVSDLTALLAEVDRLREAAALARAEAFDDCAAILRGMAGKRIETAEEWERASFTFSNQAVLIRRALSAEPKGESNG